MLQRLTRLRKNAQMVILQAPVAGGICIFLSIFAKSRSLAALGMTPARLFSANCKAATHKDSGAMATAGGVKTTARALTERSCGANRAAQPRVAVARKNGTACRAPTTATATSTAGRFGEPGPAANCSKTISTTPAGKASGRYEVKNCCARR